MDRIKLEYSIAHLEKAKNAIHKISPECSEKIKECLDLLKEIANHHSPYRGHSLEYDYHSLRS